MKHFVYLALMLFFNACSNNSSQQQSQNQKDSIPEVGAWADEAINHYLESNLSKWNPADGIPMVFKEVPQIRNQRHYCVAKISHDSKDRFVTTQMIYIDSITKAVFEYDNLNDSLIPWPQSRSADKGHVRANKRSN